jgi:ATP-binding cassette subfamily B protein/subfamily B ATP-binding cassette protein MsbA
MSSWRRQVFGYLRPYRLAFGVALLQVAAIGACELLKPWPLKVVIDNVLGNVPLPWAVAAGWSKEALLVAACIALVALYALLSAVSVVNNYTTIRIGQGMVSDLRRDLYAHLQRLSLAFHTRREVGDLLYRVTADTYAIQALTMNALFPVLSATILLVGMFIVMLRMDWLLTLLAVSVVPLLVGSISILGRRIERAATSARERESHMYSLVQRAMSAIRIIQAFTKEEDEHRQFMSASRASLAAGLRLYTFQTVYSGVINVVIAMGTALVVWVGARHVLDGHLSVGEMVVFTAYLASLYGPINSILQSYALIQAAKAGIQRVFEILAVERDLPDGTRELSETAVRGEVQWEGVSFGYSTGPPVLKGIDLQVAAGERIAIVGPTGAGKSTLLSLVPRLYDPQHGRVSIDGVDVREFRLVDLRRRIAMVLQPPLVFPTTIRENIAYGRPESTLEEVMAAARLARAHDFIERMPAGYETVIGEQGSTLSEGERQRLTIARAMLREARILILDEPTSSVDVETEALIMEGIDHLVAGKTTFIIAHRLSTVRQADRIVVLRGGEIVELGTFADLIRANGPFAALYRTQFAGDARGRLRHEADAAAARDA